MRSIISPGASIHQPGTTLLTPTVPRGKLVAPLRSGMGGGGLTAAG
jgi:hypothetical protein